MGAEGAQRTGEVAADRSGAGWRATDSSGQHDGGRGAAAGEAARRARTGGEAAEGHTARGAVELEHKFSALNRSKHSPLLQHTLPQRPPPPPQQESRRREQTNVTS